MHVVEGESMLDKDDLLLDDDLNASEIFDNESSRDRKSVV